MSEPFEELASRAETNPTTAPGEAPESARSERRRSRRWKAFIPVFVYGYGAGREPFHEEAYSAVVSENGGLLVMTARVQSGHSLLITNRATQEERECRVAYVGTREPDQPAVAVEFMEPAADFWRLTRPSQNESTDASKQNGGA
jgi:hypothetical protein